MSLDYCVTHVPGPNLEAVQLAHATDHSLRSWPLMRKAVLQTYVAKIPDVLVSDPLKPLPRCAKVVLMQGPEIQVCH
jgi:hypothetical protein